MCTPLEFSHCISCVTIIAFEMAWNMIRRSGAPHGTVIKTVYKDSSQGMVGVKGVGWTFYMGDEGQGMIVIFLHCNRSSEKLIEGDAVLRQLILCSKCSASHLTKSLKSTSAW